MSELTEKQKERIKELYLEGKTSTEIAKDQSLRIRRSKIDAYYNELKSEIPRERKKSEYQKNLPESRIRQAYVSGESKDDIAKRFHIGKDRLNEIINTYDSSTIEKHNEKLAIQRGKILNAQKTKQGFHRIVENPQEKYYCVVSFTNKILIRDGSGNPYTKEHITDMLTPAIRGREDYEHYKDIIDRNRGNIPIDFTPYCFNAKTGKIYNLFEFEAMMGFN